MADSNSAAGRATPGRVPHLPPDEATRCAARLRENVELALRGKPEVVRRSVETFIAGGHLLLEDVPGVGKTTLAHALARSVAAKFHRIQFTSDLLPGDLLGASIPELRDGVPTGALKFQPGPIFANVILADEINRASPKAQSALLEAMDDGCVSIDGITRSLPQPFFVVATQNPLEHHGTHPLPESQLDRFMMCTGIGYPSPEDEAGVLRDDPAHSSLPQLDPVVTTAEMLGMQAAAEQIKFDESLVAYLLAIIKESREHESLELGISPRAGISLRRAAQARALVDGRDYCIPEDVRDLAVDVLSHRIVVDPRMGRTAGGEETAWVLREILDRVSIPL